MKRTPILLAILVLVFSISVVQAIDITNCMSITTSGVYYLTADIINSANAICIDIQADNVILDCLGHTIDAGTTSSKTGIRVENANNVTIKNCILTDWFYEGILFYGSTNSVINNIINHKSGAYGIHLHNSNNNTIENFTGYTWDGIAGIILLNSNNNTLRNIRINPEEYKDAYGILLQSSNYNKIYNTFVNNEYRVGIYLLYSNNNTLNNLTTNNNSNIYTCYNPEEEGTGILLYGSSHNNLTNIISLYNRCALAASGIDLIADSNYNILTNITASYNEPHGIYLSGSSHNILDNIITTFNTYTGIRIESSNNNTLSNMITSNNYNGLDLSGSFNRINRGIISNNEYGCVVDTSYSNLLYNLLFNNSNNVIINDDTQVNFWNITNQTGTRIYGAGTNIGGNYWANPSGTGYSETCADTNADGFCDQPYDAFYSSPCNLNCSNNTDFLPLSGNYSPTPPCNFKSLNITTFNELTNEQIYFNMHITNGTLDLYLSNIWNFSETACNTSLPTNNVTVAISNSSYYSPRYYIGYIGNAVLKAYLLPLNDSSVSLATFQVQEAGTSPPLWLPDVLIDVYKDLGGWYVIIASMKTDYNGLASFFLNSHTSYIVNASRAGYRTKSLYVTPTNASYYQIIALQRLTYGQGFGNMFYDIDYYLHPEPRIVYNYSTRNNTFVFFIRSKNATLSYYGMNISDKNGVQIFSQTVDSSPTGGYINASINCSLYTDYLNVTIFFLTPTYSDEVYKQTFRYIIFQEAGAFSLETLLGSLKSTSGASDISIGMLSIITALTVSGAVSKFATGIAGQGLLFALLIFLLGFAGWVSLHVLMMFGVVTLSLFYWRGGI